MAPITPGYHLAFMALIHSMEDGSVSKEKLDGFTPQQRFFLGYAQIWCQNARPESSRTWFAQIPTRLANFVSMALFKTCPNSRLPSVAQKDSPWFPPTPAVFGKTALLSGLVLLRRSRSIAERCRSEGH